MAHALKERAARERRHQRVRRRVVGTPERPRLNVYRSLSHIYGQIIDDSQGRTIVAASTIDPEVRQQLGQGTKTDEAKVVGRVLAQRALAQGVKRIVFDRGGYVYHGRVKALAEGAREGGLEF